ncbi:glutamate racemase [Verrucomicrobia bacterium LW23]|nr:glutamate racemase [Verrucomicrobia bacterium LW23]
MHSSGSPSPSAPLPSPDKQRQSIGIFDSGVGGLTVVSAVHRLLPREDIIYFGDTGRVPYGNKSPEMIIQYSLQISRFLISQGVKAVVVACNTATAHALSSLRASLSVPVMGVVVPGVEAALSATRNGRVGIIGTYGTIQSGAYQKALLARRPDVQLTAIPTPLLVPLIEEDWLTHAATHLVLAEYLSPIQAARCDSLVLACTHYPLAKGVIGSIMGEDVTLVDSADNMARDLARRLETDNLLRPAEDIHTGRIRLHVSDLPTQFATLARRFLGVRVGAIDKVVLD